MTDGPKPKLVGELGATYHCGKLEAAGQSWGVVVERTGAAAVFYEQAAASLERADRARLERLIARRVPVERFAEAFESRPSDVKTILTF